MGHPDFGKAAPCQCRQTEDSLPSRMEALRRYSNLGALSRLTFASTRSEGPLYDVAARRMFADSLAQAAAYAENPDGWLVLTGPSGSGKTHLAAAIANRCIERQQTTFFIMVADLLDHLRAAYSPTSELAYDELFEQVRNVPVLVLDDLGPIAPRPGRRRSCSKSSTTATTTRCPPSSPSGGRWRGWMNRCAHGWMPRGARSWCSWATSTTALPWASGRCRSEMLTRMNFATFDVAGGLRATKKDQEELARALHAAQTFATFPEGWLLFTGNRGSGKTHLSVAIAGENLRQGRQVFFAFVPTLLDHLRMTYSPNSPVHFDELFEQVLNVPLLILDDLGAENSTPWAEEKLYQIVVHRHEARLATVITTASTMEELEEGKPRIASRLVDSMVVEWVAIDAPNYRDQRRR